MTCAKIIILFSYYLCTFFMMSIMESKIYAPIVLVSILFLYPQKSFGLSQRPTVLIKKNHYSTNNIPNHQHQYSELKSRKYNNINDDSNRINTLLLKAINIASSLARQETNPKNPKSKLNEINQNKIRKSFSLSFKAKHYETFLLTDATRGRNYLSLPVESYSILDSSLVSRVSSDTFKLSLPLRAVTSTLPITIDADLSTDITVKPNPLLGKIAMYSGPLYFIPLHSKSQSSSSPKSPSSPSSVVFDEKIPLDETGLPIWILWDGGSGNGSSSNKGNSGSSSSSNSSSNGSITTDTGTVKTTTPKIKASTYVNNINGIGIGINTDTNIVESYVSDDGSNDDVSTVSDNNDNSSVISAVPFFSSPSMKSITEQQQQDEEDNSLSSSTSTTGSRKPWMPTGLRYDATDLYEEEYGSESQFSRQRDNNSNDDGNGNSKNSSTSTSFSTSTVVTSVVSDSIEPSLDLISSNSTKELQLITDLHSDGDNSTDNNDSDVNSGDGNSYNSDSDSDSVIGSSDGNGNGNGKGVLKRQRAAIQAQVKIDITWPLPKSQTQTQRSVSSVTTALKDRMSSAMSGFGVASSSIVGKFTRRALRGSVGNRKRVDNVADVDVDDYVDDDSTPAPAASPATNMTVTTTIPVASGSSSSDTASSTGDDDDDDDDDNVISDIDVDKDVNANNIKIVANQDDVNININTTTITSTATTTGQSNVEVESLPVRAQVEVIIDMCVSLPADLSRILSFPPVRILLEQAATLTAKGALRAVGPGLVTALQKDFQSRNFTGVVIKQDE